MNAHNLKKPTSESEKPATEAGDWRTQFPSDSRQRFVNDIFDTMKKHPHYSGTDDEIRKDAEFVEEKIYSSSCSKWDYQEKIYAKLRQLLPQYRNNVRRSRQSISEFRLPASVDISEVGENWREEVYQKIQTMREKYLPALAEIHAKVAAELELFDPVPQHYETEELENMRIIDIKLQRIIFMLSVSENDLLPECKKELNSQYEKQIIDFIDAYKSMKPVSFLEEEALSLPDLPSWLPTVTLSELEDDDQMNAQFPLMMPFMAPPGTAQMQSQQHQIQVQQQKLHLMQYQQRLNQWLEWERREEQYLYLLEQQLPGILKREEFPHPYQVGFDSGFLPSGQYPGFYPAAYTNPVALCPAFSPIVFPAPFAPSTSTLSTPSLAPGNIENPLYDAYISHQHATYGEAGPACPAPDTAGNGMPTISSPSLLPGFEKAGDSTHCNASTIDLGKPDIKEQTHDPMVNMNKPNSLRSTVVTMADEAVAAVGEELAAVRKQGVHARTFFIQTGMTGAEKMKCYLGAFAIRSISWNLGLFVENFMDTNNWRPTPPSGENTMDGGDWRTTLRPDSRQRIVNKIMDTLKRHLPFTGQEGLNELRKIAVRFEEKIFTAASSQSDYLRRISLKMLTMETKSQNTLSNTGNTSKPPDPAYLYSTAQTGPANGGDWQEEVYQKVSLPVNVLPVTFPGHGHSQTFNAPDSLPKAVARTLNQGSSPMSMDFHPVQQTLLLVGTNVGDIALWEVGSRERLVSKNFKVWDLTACSMSLQAALVKDPAVSVNRVIWSPDGSLFGVAYSRHIVHIYSYHGGEEVRQHLEIDAHVGGVNDLAFSHPNKQLCVITCGDDKTIKVWDATNGTRQYTFEGHEAPVYSVSPHCKENIQFIFSTAVDGKIKAWLYDNIGSRVDFEAPGRWCTTMAYSADGTRLFSCGTSKDGESFLVEWNESEGAVKRTYQGFRKRSLGVVQFDTTKNRYLAAGDDFSIKFWDMDNVQPLTSIDADGGLPASPCIRFNKDGSLLVVSANDNGIKVLANSDGMQLLCTLENLSYDALRTSEAPKSAQFQHQLGLQQQSNQVQQNMQQRLQASGQTSNSLLQSQNLIDQQKQLYQSQRAVLETPSNSTAQTGQANGGDWQEEVYQKIKAMKETYLPELIEMHQKIAAKLLQHGSLPQQPKSEQLDKLKLFKTMLERLFHFLTVSQADIVPAYKEKLSSYERQILSFINANRPRKLISAMQQGQLPSPHMHSMQQSQPQINQTQSHDNQMNPQLQSINLQGSMSTMQPNNMTSMQHNSLSSFAPVNFENPVYDAYISHQHATYEEAGSECPAPDTARNGMPTMLPPSLLPGFEKDGDANGNALTTAFGKPDIKEQTHDSMVNMAKPNSLRLTVVTMADEAVTAVGEELAAMRKQGVHARTFFIQTGMTGAEKMKCRSISWNWGLFIENFMDTNNWRPTPPSGENTMDGGDWRTTLQPDSRQRIVNKIMDTLKRHLPFSGQEGLNELRKIAVRFEEKIFTAASSQSDYLRRISLKMLTMETKSQSTMSNPGNTSKPPDPGSQGMQNQVHSQGQSIPVPLQSNQPQARQQLLPQSVPNNMASAGVQSSAGLQSGMPPVSGLSQNTTISSVVGQNSNMQNMSGMSQNSMGQGMTSNIFANQQRQMQGRQQVLPQQQQQLYHQQLQQQLMKQKIQQGNLQPSLMQSHMQQQQQQNLLPPTQLQSSQQSGMQTSSVMQPSAMQSTPLPGQQNQQQSTQSMLQQHQQSVLRQQQQPQQTTSSGIHQQQTPMTQQSMMPQQQQPHMMGQQTNSANIQQNQLMGQQNTIADMQQQRMLGQSSNLPNLQQQQQQQLQQQQLMAQQNNLSNIHQQQLGSQSNISGLQQQQQQLIGSQSGNSSMQTNQQSLHMLSQPQVPLQQTQQTASNLLPTQGQTSQQPQQQQQLMSQMQSQSTQLHQQLGLQQQPNQVQQNLQQRLQASGQTSNSLLQSQNLIDQQKQLYQSQRAVPETSSTSLDSTAQTGQANGGDWQEEVYQKIKVMKETYLPELNEMHQKIAAKLLQHDSLPQQPKSEQLDKLKIFKTMLERILHFLTVSKANIVPAYKEKLSSYEKQIINFINTNRPRKPISAMQQGQLPPPHMQPMQQPQPQINQTQSHDNQMNPQLQSINLQGSMQTMQPNNITSMQHNSLSSLPVASTAQQTMLNSLQPGSNLDPGQGNALGSMQQVATGPLQQNLVSNSQQANISSLSSQSGITVLQQNMNPLQSNSNMLQHQHMKQQQEQQILQSQKYKQQRQMQQQYLQQKQQLMQQQQQLHQQAKQQLPTQLQAHLHQMNDANDMRQGINVKPGVFQQLLPAGQRQPYPHQQPKPGAQYPISSPQLLQAASPQMPQHSSPQIDQQSLLTSISKTGTPLQSANSPFVVPSPSTPLAPSPMPAESEKPIPGTSSLSNAVNVGNQQGTVVQTGSQSLAIGTPGISASPLLAEFTGADGTHANALTTVSSKSSITEQPLERLMKAVKSMSSSALCASVSDIGSVISMTDRIAGSAPGNGSRAAVGEDLVAMTKCRLQARNFITQDGMSGTKKMKRNTCAMPLNVISSAGGINDSFKQLTGSETSDLESTATSTVKRPRIEANHALLEEIREINQRLIDTVVDICDEDVDSGSGSVAATAEGGAGMIVKCSFSAVALSSNLKSQYMSAQMSPIQPLRLLVPKNYPNCSPILLDKFPVEVSKEYEDLSVKAKLRFSISLRSLSQPMSLGEIARTWDVCARAVISEHAQESGGGSFSSKYGTWENCSMAA
ncbi:hypothetical protein GQ457_07G032460 [Hibiscus cannabinus]